MTKTIIIFIMWLLIWLSSLYFYKLEVKYYSFNSACQHMWYDYYTPSFASQWACVSKENEVWIRYLFELFVSERITEWPYKWFYK